MIKKEGNVILGNIEINKSINYIRYYREGIWNREYFPSLIYHSDNKLKVIWYRENNWHRNSGPAYVEFGEYGICLRWYREDKFIKKMEVRR